MANIKSFGDLKKEEKAQKPKKDYVSHYTGGQKSGLAVENGGHPGNREGVLGKMLQDCREITLYKNGFIVDGGEFRDLSVPENKKFMEEVEAGFLPAELHVKGKYVNVALTDRSNITYTPPAAAEEKTPYCGSGKKLGGDNAAEMSPEELKKLESLPGKLVQKDVDMNKPTTNLQIRLYNGKRVEETFNHDHTVEDLYESIYNITPVDFSLLYDFPLKVLPKSRLTLEEAQIIDAVITQKKL